MLKVVFSVSPSESENQNLKLVILKSSSKENSKMDKSSDPIAYTLRPQDSPITIGRGNCLIKLNHSFLSKLHCTIVFNQSDKFWEISDGHQGRSSTNGTWVMMNSKYEISDETIVKISNNTFKISLI